MKNAGKNFESRFKASVPDYCLKYRPVDAAQSFGGGSDALRFSIKSPCDFMLFDTRRRLFYCLELKSTKGGSISYETKNSKQGRMIHLHQIKSLWEFGSYDYVVSGFVLNYRNETLGTERSFFMSIDDFLFMTSRLKKASCNIEDITKYGALEIPGQKARTQYSWDIETLLDYGGHKYDKQ